MKYKPKNKYDKYYNPVTKKLGTWQELKDTLGVDFKKYIKEQRLISPRRLAFYAFIDNILDCEDDNTSYTDDPRI